MALESIRKTVDFEEKRKKSLYNSIIEGMSFSAMAGFGDSMISAFAVALKATSTEIGLLATLPSFFGSLSQLAGAKLVDAYKNRKKIVLACTFFHAILWLPIALIPLAFASNQVALLILLYSLAIISVSIGIPAWASMMGDLVWLKQRGRYFGKRNALAGAVLLSATLIAGYFINQYPSNLVLLGFGASFFIAFLFRTISWLFLKKIHEPVQVFEQQRQPNFLEFVSRIRSHNYGSFVVFVAMIHFSTYIAGPFFAPYMLNELRFSIFEFTVVHASAALAQVLFISRWGKQADRFGNVKVLALASILVSLIPILWLFTASFWLIVLINMFAGMAWAGFNLSASNFIFDSVETKSRARYIAYYSIIVSTLGLLGSIIGGLYLTNIGEKFFFSSAFHVLLIASGASRLLFSTVLLPKISEERKVANISKRKLFFSLFEFSPTEFVTDQMFGLVLLKTKASKIVEKTRWLKKEIETSKKID